MKVNLHDKLVHIHAMKHLVMYALLSCLSVSYATAAEVLIDGITYTTSSDGTAFVTGYSSDIQADLSILPSFSYGGDEYTVTEIYEYTFYNCIDLISVRIPNTVTQIGIYAFAGCRNMVSAIIPNSVTQINSLAFVGCKAMEYVTIPNHLEEIEYGVFDGCSALTTIWIPEDVTKIDAFAFHGCSSLISVTIPNSVKSIGFGAFSGCSRLASINIPDGVTSIGNSAFPPCFSLKEIKVLNPIPIEIDSYTFYLLDKTSCQLIVPQGSLEAYRNANYWKDFLNIIEDTASGIDDVESGNNGFDCQVVNGEIRITGAANQLVEIYSMDGVLRHRAAAVDGGISFSPGQSGMYVIKCGQNTAKVMVR